MTKDILGFRAIFGILGGFCDGGGEYLTGILQLLTDEFKLTFFPWGKTGKPLLESKCHPINHPKTTKPCLFCMPFLYSLTYSPF